MPFASASGFTVLFVRLKLVDKITSTFCLLTTVVPKIVRGPVLLSTAADLLDRLRPRFLFPRDEQE